MVRPWLCLALLYASRNTPNQKILALLVRDCMLPTVCSLSSSVITDSTLWQWPLRLVTVAIVVDHTLCPCSGGAEFLQQFGSGLVQILCGFIGNVKDRGMLTLIPLMDTIIQVCDHPSIQILTPFWPTGSRGENRVL